MSSTTENIIGLTILIMLPVMIILGVALVTDKPEFNLNTMSPGNIVPSKIKNGVVSIDGDTEVYRVISKTRNYYLYITATNGIITKVEAR